MAQIPEDVKNQILAARQSFASTTTELDKPLIQFSGAVARAAAGATSQSRLATYGAIQQAKGEREKAKGEVQAASTQFEESIAKQVPELGSPELVKKEYDIAMNKITDKISYYDARIAKEQEYIKEIQDDYRHSPKTDKDKERRDKNIEDAEDDIDRYRAEQRAWKEYAGKGQADVVRGYLTGYISDLASSYENREIAQQTAREKADQQKKEVAEALKKDPNAMVYYVGDVPFLIKDANKNNLNIYQLPPYLQNILVQGKKITAGDLQYIGSLGQWYNKTVQSGGSSADTQLKALEKLPDFVFTNLGKISPAELKGDKGGMFYDPNTGKQTYSDKNLTQQGYTLIATPTEVKSGKTFSSTEFPGLTFGSTLFAGGVKTSPAEPTTTTKTETPVYGPQQIKWGVSGPNPEQFEILPGSKEYNMLYGKPGTYTDPNTGEQYTIKPMDTSGQKTFTFSPELQKALDLQQKQVSLGIVPSVGGTWSGTTIGIPAPQPAPETLGQSFAKIQASPYVQILEKAAILSSPITLATYAATHPEEVKQTYQTFEQQLLKPAAEATAKALIPIAVPIAQYTQEKVIPQVIWGYENIVAPTIKTAEQIRQAEIEAGKAIYTGVIQPTATFAYENILKPVAAAEMAKLRAEAEAGKMVYEKALVPAAGFTYENILLPAAKFGVEKVAVPYIASQIKAAETIGGLAVGAYEKGIKPATIWGFENIAVPYAQSQIKSAEIIGGLAAGAYEKGIKPAAIATWTEFIKPVGQEFGREGKMIYQDILVPSAEGVAKGATAVYTGVLKPVGQEFGREGKMIYEDVLKPSGLWIGGAAEDVWGFTKDVGVAGGHTFGIGLSKEDIAAGQTSLWRETGKVFGLVDLEPGQISMFGNYYDQQAKSPGEIIPGQFKALTGREYTGSTGDRWLRLAETLAPEVFLAGIGLGEDIKLVGQGVAEVTTSKAFRGETFYDPDRKQYYYNKWVSPGLLGEALDQGHMERVYLPGTKEQEKEAITQKTVKVVTGLEEVAASIPWQGAPFFRGALALQYVPLGLETATKPKEEGGGLVPALKEAGAPLAIAAIGPSGWLKEIPKVGGTLAAYATAAELYGAAKTIGGENVPSLTSLYNIATQPFQAPFRQVAPEFVTGDKSLFGINYLNPVRQYEFYRSSADVEKAMERLPSLVSNYNKVTERFNSEANVLQTQYNNQQITAEQYNNQISKLQSDYATESSKYTADPDWQYVNNPPTSYMSELAKSKKSPLAKFAISAPIYAAQIIPYTISVPFSATIGGLQIGKGVEEIGKGKTVPGAIDIGAGALTGLLPTLLKGTGKTQPPVQYQTAQQIIDTTPTSFDLSAQTLINAPRVTTPGLTARFLANPWTYRIGIPTAIGGVAGVGSYSQYKSIPIALGAGVGVAGGIGFGQWYQWRQQPVIDVAEIKVNSIKNTGKFEDYNMQKLPVYSLETTAGQKLSIPLTEQGVTMITQEGRIPLIYSQGQLQNKAIVEAVTNKAENIANFFGISLGGAKTYYPAPKYGGMPWGGEFTYGFATPGAQPTSTKVYTEAEATKSFNKYVKYLVDQGWDEDMARSYLTYKPAASYLYLAKGEPLTAQDLITGRFPSTQTVGELSRGTAADWESMQLGVYRIPVRAPTSFVTLGRTIRGETAGMDITPWYPTGEISKITPEFLRAATAAYTPIGTITAEATKLNQLQAREFLTDVGKYGYYRYDPKFFQELASRHEGELTNSIWGINMRYTDINPVNPTLRDTAYIGQAGLSTAARQVVLPTGASRIQYLTSEAPYKEGPLTIYPTAEVKTIYTGSAKPEAFKTFESGVDVRFVRQGMLLREVSTGPTWMERFIGVPDITRAPAGTPVGPVTFGYSEGVQVFRAPAIALVKTEYLKPSQFEKAYPGERNPLPLTPDGGYAKDARIKVVSTYQTPQNEILALDKYELSDTGKEGNLVNRYIIASSVDDQADSVKAIQTAKTNIGIKDVMNAKASDIFKGADSIKVIDKSGNIVEANLEQTYATLTSPEQMYYGPKFLEIIGKVEAAKEAPKGGGKFDWLKPGYQPPSPTLGPNALRALQNADYTDDFLAAYRKGTTGPVTGGPIIKGGVEQFGGPTGPGLYGKGEPGSPLGTFGREGARQQQMAAQEYVVIGRPPAQTADFNIAYTSTAPADLALTPATARVGAIEFSFAGPTGGFYPALSAGPTTVTSLVPQAVPSISAFAATSGLYAPVAVTGIGVSKFVPGAFEAISGIGPTLSIGPAIGPTIGPVVGPTIGPVVGPTVGPIVGPTVGPTIGPTIGPVVGPTIGPVVGPVITPIVTPIVTPIPTPTPVPLVTPTITPTVRPVPGREIVPTSVVFPELKIRTKGKEVKKKKVTRGYKLEVRRRRKFRVESPFALPKEEAIKLGIQKTLGTAAATFRIVPTGEEAKSLGLPAPSARELQYFRAPKTKVPQALTFVQKERQRIVTAGEKREISYVGVRAAAAAKTGTTFKKPKGNIFSSKRKGGRQKWF